MDARVCRSRQSENPPNPEEIAFRVTVSDERSVCLGNPLAKSKSLIWITSVLCGMQYLKNAKLEATPRGERGLTPRGERRMAITSCGRWAVAVVDDDAAVCDSMRCLLEAYDLDVQTYQRGADFLKNQPEIACLITDYDLPDIDGLELISELRKRGSQVPMIMSTAATDPWIKRCVAEAGIKFVLEKPYSYEALLGAIREELLG